MATMRLVYVAGPFRGPTPWAVEENVRHAERYALEVARLGGMPVCPHTNTRHFDGIGTAQFWLDGTMRLMEKCDAMVLCAGWQRSSGARAEKARFEELGWGVAVFDLSDAFLFVSGGATEVNVDDEEYQRLRDFLAA